MRLSAKERLYPLIALTVLLQSSADALSLSSLSKRAFDYGTSDIINTFRPADKQDNKKQNDPPQHEPHEAPVELSPCSSHHPLTNGFYDLSDLSSIGKESIVAWSARGYDYNKNFTLGVCSSPLKPGVDVNNNYQGFGGDKVNSSEVGAVYTDAEGQKFSIGNFNSTPVFRGKKLTLTYTDGSYCPNKIDKKSTILSFTCDREILQKASVSFVGALHDCDYFFEVRTVHACPTAQKADNLAVIWIFLFILLAALFVYCCGGFLYKRIVLNRRGWKQIPSYNLGTKVSSALSGNVS
jgi:cation-dependent mannose-6-phosphate receptor